MSEITESLRQSVKALDDLPKQFKTPTTTKLRRLTCEIIAELESDSPDAEKLAELTEQVNQING